MIVLDASIVNVALPSIRDALSFAPSDLQWIVNAYTLVFGGFLLLGGRLADRFGRKRLFIIGLAIFFVASVLGGAAQSSLLLVLARGLQGFGGAIMAPAALSLITVIFSEGAERNKALGVWGAIAAGGAAIGVLLGGLLVEYLDWRWVFFVNVPFALLAIAGTIKFVPESSNEHTTGFDVGGAVTVTAGLMILVFGLVKGNDYGWASATTIGTFVVAALLLGTFVALQKKGSNPLIPLRIFEQRNVIGSDLGILLLGAAIFGMFFYISIYMQNVLGFSAIKTGMAFLPVSLVIMASAGVGSGLLSKFSPRTLVPPAMLVSATGLALFTRVHPGGSYVETVLIPLVFLGAGMGVIFVSLTSSGVAGVPERDSGLASALLNTGQQIGGAIGLAVFTAVAQSRTSAVAVAGIPTPADVTSGWAWGFGVSAAFLVIGAIVTAIFIDITKEEAATAAKQAVAAT